jgi:Recombination endonuclease VII/HNH endonuclease
MKGKISKPNLTHERVREVLDYNPASGEFVWKVSLSKNVKAGAVAGGSFKINGYRYVTIEGFEIPAARLAWFYMTGEWPRTKVQFVDGDKHNLRYTNLTLSVGVHGEFDFQTREGRTAYLKEYRKANPEIEKARSLREDFGLSLEQYKEMHDRQNGKCAICNEPETQMRNGKIKALAVDHSHKTGAIRGLLCSDCNTGIGKLKDDPTIILSAYRYLLGIPVTSTGQADAAQTT